MLTSAMEVREASRGARSPADLASLLQVSGIEGTFKITCQHTMRVLRENKESIIAVLEAFVHDPLINWRLVQGGRQVEGKTAGGDNGPGGARRPRGDETNIYDGAPSSFVLSPSFR